MLIKNPDRKFFGKFNRCFLGVLSFLQGVYVLFYGRFFNFSGDLFVDASSARYPLSLFFIAFGGFLLYRVLYIKDRSVKADEKAITSQADPMRSRRFPLILKVVIAYFLLYAFLTETFFVLNWDRWVVALEGQSVGTQLGLLTQGPFLGIIFMVAVVGLAVRKTWGRNWAVAGLIIATLADAKNFAGAFSGENAVNKAYFVSLITVSMWNLVWLYLLYSQSVGRVLGVDSKIKIDGST